MPNWRVASPNATPRAGADANASGRPSVAARRASRFVPGVFSRRELDPQEREAPASACDRAADIVEQQGRAGFVFRRDAMFSSFCRAK
jgi:hypothetical protein